MKNRIFLLLVFLFVLSTAIYAQFTENFDGVVYPPTGWVVNGVTRISTAPQSPPYCLEFDASTDYIVTPLLVNPNVLSYYHKKGTGNYQFYIQYSSSQSGPWTDLPGYPVFAGLGWTQKTEDLSTFSNIYLRWIPQATPPPSKIFFLDGVSVTPGAILPPTVPSTAVTFPNLGVHSLDISWTRGDGTYCVAFLHQGPGVPTFPVDGTDYLPSTDWNLKGTQLDASGYYCIYNGAGNSVTVTNLLAITNYWVVVYEYNGSGPTSVYLMNGAQGNATTLDTTVPVELSSFNAYLTQQYFVELKWTTQSETDAQGYMVYRNNTTNLAQAYQVNPYLIPATNTSNATDYVFTDMEATPGTWYYWLESKNISGISDYYGPISITITDGTNSTVVPDITSLMRVYPNPFNPDRSGLSGSFELAKAENIQLAIYNIRGQKVRTLSSGVRNAGTFPISWNGQDDNGNNCKAGMYFIMMNTSSYSTSKKIVLIR